MRLLEAAVKSLSGLLPALLVLLTIIAKRPRRKGPVVRTQRWALVAELVAFVLLLLLFAGVIAFIAIVSVTLDPLLTGLDTGVQPYA
jgi:predicted anti-sigma-YlaC factor YlaD